MVTEEMSPKRSFFNGKYAALTAWGAILLILKRQYRFAILAYVLVGGGGGLEQPYASYGCI